MVAKKSGVELADLAPQLVERERANGTVDVARLADLLRGGEAANARRKQVEQLVARHPVLGRRDYVYQNHTQRYESGLEKTFHYAKFLHSAGLTELSDQNYAYDVLGERLPPQVHRSMFIPTLENQADNEQQREWLPLARQFKILGAYAQTELGHGSNVQGIETTATYDRASQEFVIHSPTLTSRKWWPGGLGKTCTHAIVHAKLLIDGESKGVQAFLVQLRSLKDHQPLPGIELGDIGPKVGFNAIDNGYAVFHHVRIPRRNMMMRYARVLPDGTFVEPASDKLVYLSMMQVRAYLISKFGFNLGAAVTITTRFSAARVQGFDPETGDERQVLDYQNQQSVLFPLLGLAYAANFAGRAMTKMHDDTLTEIKAGARQEVFAPKLAELHAVSSGLKAWLANRANDGIESCRRLCGGLGFLQSSNLAHLFAEMVGASTYEGTFDVLVQQHARFLLKSRSASSKFNASLACSAGAPTDFGHLHVLIDAFRARAGHARTRLALAMKQSDDANANMNLMTAASVSQSELALLEIFAAGVDAMPAGPTKQSVHTLCQLFGVSLLVASLGDFRERDYISSEQGEMARRHLLSLLPLIRRDAVRLTDAFDFSDFELNSTIGRFDGDMYRALVAAAKLEPLNRSEVPEGYAQYLKPLIKSAL